MSYPQKGQADYFAEGDWNATCFQCGRKRKASQMVKNWQNYWVCPEHNEPRHPQDFVRGVPETQTPPWVQPQSDSFTWSIACGNAAGTADALVLTPTVTCIGPYPGQIFEFTATATNTGPATVTILSQTVDIELSGAALAAGDIVSGTVYQLTYEDEIFHLSSW